MNKFIEPINNNEYKYKILVYPNITYQKELSKDSYIVFLHNLITELGKIRNDLHWIVLHPEYLPIFDSLDNVTTYIYTLPSHPNKMRIDFKSDSLLKILSEINSIDVVFSNLPEATLQLKNLIYNHTNYTPEFIGYCHWFEFSEAVKFKTNVLDFNVLGMLEMIQCGVNTNSQKQMLLEYSKTKYSDNTVESLSNIVKPMYIGAEYPLYSKESKFNTRTIAFNHRPDIYKGYDWFIDMMDLLWKTRQDFKVWVPLLGTVDRPYIINGLNSTRHEYLTSLSKCTVGVCAEQKYKGWAISAVDGLSVNVPFVFKNHDYYKELAADIGIYYDSNEEFLDVISKFLNGEYDDYNTTKRFSELTWNNLIYQYNDMFNTAFSLLKPIRDTEACSEIIKFIKNKGIVSDEQILNYMGWGQSIGFSKYRNWLRNNENIKLTKSGYEWK